jgi:hypothetical protein
VAIGRAVHVNCREQFDGGDRAHCEREQWIAMWRKNHTEPYGFITAASKPTSAKCHIQTTQS